MRDLTPGELDTARNELAGLAERAKAWGWLDELERDSTYHLMLRDLATVANVIVFSPPPDPERSFVRWLRHRLADPNLHPFARKAHADRLMVMEGTHPLLTKRQRGPR